VELADAIFALHRQWMRSRLPQSWVFMEQLHLHESFIGDRMARENYRFPIYGLTSRVAKHERIGWLVGPISQAHYMWPQFHFRTTLEREENGIMHKGVEEDLIRVFMEQEYSRYLVGGGGVAHEDMLDALASTQDPEVQKRIMWPRPDAEADPNDVLRQWRAARRQGRTWASA
jgi:hypothetical protein